MTFIRHFHRTIFSIRTRFACFALLAVTSSAHADWTLVQADAHPVVIHETSLYEAEVGQRLATNDIVETHGNANLQIEDDTGNVVALGPDTRVLLARDAHIALLRGWLKALNRCDTSVNCHAPVIETAHDRYTPGRDASVVIAASPSGYDDADALFCESGSVSVQPVANPRSKVAALQVSAGQFVARHAAMAPASAPATTASAAPASMAMAARPDAAFVAAIRERFDFARLHQGARADNSDGTPVFIPCRGALGIRGNRRYRCAFIFSLDEGVFPGAGAGLD